MSSAIKISLLVCTSALAFGCAQTQHKAAGSPGAGTGASPLGPEAIGAAGESIVAPADETVAQAATGDPLQPRRATEELPQNAYKYGSDTAYRNAYDAGYRQEDKVGSTGDGTIETEPGNRYTLPARRETTASSSEGEWVEGHYETQRITGSDGRTFTRQIWVPGHYK